MWRRAGVQALGIFEGPEAWSWQVLSCQGPEWTLIHKSAGFLWLLMKLSSYGAGSLVLSHVPFVYALMSLVFCSLKCRGIQNVLPGI